MGFQGALACVIREYRYLDILAATEKTTHKDLVIYSGYIAQKLLTRISKCHIERGQKSM